MWNIIGQILALIIFEEIHMIIHELGHAITYVILTRSFCQCYISWNINKTFKLYKIRFVFANEGPYVRFMSTISNFNLFIVLIMGPIFGLSFLFIMRYIFEMYILDVLIISMIIADIYPWNGNDSMSIIRMFHPSFREPDVLIPIIIYIILFIYISI